MPVYKRHIVLYAVIAGALVLILIASVWETLRYVSDIRSMQSASRAAEATSTPTQPLLTTLVKPAFQWEVVTTTAAQEQGLGGRADIPQNYGMLFVFPKDDTYGFWMKGMLAPIDMLWLSDTGQVVYEQQDVDPSTYPNVFYPTAPARFVLETRAGEAARQGWVVGSMVPLPLPYGK